MKTLLVFSILTLGLATAAIAFPGGSMRRELTPQEHLLYVQEHRGDNWRGLSVEQRCALSEQMRRQWAALTPAALQKLKQHLDAEWKALPDAEKQRLEQRIADRQERRADRAPRRAEGGRQPHERPCAAVHSSKP